MGTLSHPYRKFLRSSKTPSPPYDTRKNPDQTIRSHPNAIIGSRYTWNVQHRSGRAQGSRLLRQPILHTYGCASVTIDSGRTFEDLRRDIESNENLHSKPMMDTEDIYLSKVPYLLGHKAKEVLHRHESLRSGHLGEIKAAKHYIDLVPGTCPFRYQPYRAGPKQG